MLTDKKVKTYERIQPIVHRLRKNGKKIVLTSGCYDVLHLGHLLHLAQCRQHGEVLIVAVGNDQTIQHLKGKDRPILTASVRARMVAALEIVDFVVISEEYGKMDHIKLVTLLKPEVYVVNQTDSHFTEKQNLIRQYGGRVIGIKRVPPREAVGISTSQLVKKLLSL
jgi:rfaE bifunctional protein nucleotidyltransferase chain/domain